MPDIVIDNIRGGRNGIDFPGELPGNQCQEGYNVDWFDTPLGKKRGGAVAIGVTGGGGFSGTARMMVRHVPAGDETAAELWAIDTAPAFKRLVGGTSWAAPTVTDALTGGRPQDATAVSFNGKLFWAYQSAQDRLHVWDPVLATLRRVGLAQPGAVSVADTGAGTYPATLRYYRKRVIQLNGSIIVRRSEPSASVAFTPSGSGTHARITRGTVPGEGETHWEIEISTDNSQFYVLYGQATGAVGGAIAVGTTTQDSDFSLDDITDLTTSEDAGSFTLPPSVRYLSTDGNRLIMAGNYGTTMNARIWFSAVLGSSDHGDDERIIFTNTIKGYVDINEKDGGVITGISMPINGIIYVFKYRQVWKLLPTGDPNAPYIPKQISNTIGCIYDKTIVMMEDHNGNPVVGFLSHCGPYYIGAQEGLTACGRDVEDVWYGLNEREGDGKVNLDATTVVGHGVFHARRHQTWWFVAIGTYNSPYTKICLDVRQSAVRDQYGARGGWAVHEGRSCQAVCSVMFSETIAASMSRILVPYVGQLVP